MTDKENPKGDKPKILRSLADLGRFINPQPDDEGVVAANPTKLTDILMEASRAHSARRPDAAMHMAEAARTVLEADPEVRRQGRIKILYYVPPNISEGDFWGTIGNHMHYIIFAPRKGNQKYLGLSLVDMQTAFDRTEGISLDLLIAAHRLIMSQAELRPETPYDAYERQVHTIKMLDSLIRREKLSLRGRPLFRPFDVKDQVGTRDTTANMDQLNLIKTRVAVDYLQSANILAARYPGLVPLYDKTTDDYTHFSLTMHIPSDTNRLPRLLNSRLDVQLARSHRNFSTNFNKLILLQRATNYANGSGMEDDRVAYEMATLLGL